MNQPRVLLYDIETAFAVVGVFSLRRPHIGLDQIIEHPRITAWSAKWYDPTGVNKKVMFDSEFHSDPRTMLTGLRDLIDQADVLVGYNSDGFDYPWIEGELDIAGIPQPSPSQTVDLWKLGKKHARLISGKLDYMALRLLGQRKTSHEGFALWKKCQGFEGPEEQEKAWRTMKRYAMQDTRLLEPLFTILRKYAKTYNAGLFTDEAVCPACGSERIEKRGYDRTIAGVFQRYHCLGENCGKWFRGKTRLKTTEMRP